MLHALPAAAIELRPCADEERVPRLLDASDKTEHAESWELQFRDA
jgi:hypothetical protein